jgi:hypothetical protein
MADPVTLTVVCDPSPLPSDTSPEDVRRAVDGALKMAIPILKPQVTLKEDSQ